MADMTQKIVPHLWYDREAKEAAERYTSIFPASKISAVSQLHDTPSGDADIVAFQVWGQDFMAISAGPLFKFTPAISFFVNFDPSRDPDAKKHLDEVWKGLADGGSALMPLDKYPFSEWYGWIQDKYGVSWQLILTDPTGEPRPPIVPSLLFVGERAGKAEEAMAFYLSVFKNGKQGGFFRYGPGQKPDKEGTVMFADFMIEGQWFAAMDSAQQHDFGFNEAISLMVSCETQEEIDYYWERLSAVPEAEQCGWLKDKYGVSWQIIPTAMEQMMQHGTREQIDRLTQAFMPMKKLDLATLEKAYDGK